MNSRIKQVRQHPTINMSQEAFGARIGLTGSGISLLESGRRNASEQVILSICREYSVSEEWLRNGTGEMFMESSTFSLDEYAASRGCTCLERDILKAYFDLDSDVRGKVLAHFTQSLAKHQQLSDTEDHIEAAAETWNGKTREQLHAELDQALDVEKERWTAEQAEAQSPSRDTMADAG